MFKQALSAFGAITVAAAALTLSPGVATAQHHGGGGGHASFHASAAHFSGGYHGGAARYAGGRYGASRYYGGGYRGGWYGRGWGYGLGWYGLGLALGYPWYGNYPWYNNYYVYNTYPDAYYYGTYSDNYYAPSYYEAAPSYDLYSSPPSGYVNSTQPAATVADDAHVRVLCPAGAQVWFENQPTNQQGTVRYFDSPPLTPGQDFVYHVRAQWQQNGQPVSETRDVHVHAGDAVTVSFTNPVAGTPSREPVPAPAVSGS